MTTHKDKSTLPLGEATNNGWLSRDYNIADEARDAFAHGAIAVQLDDGTMFAWFEQKIEVFHNDGEYIHTFEIPRNPPT